MKTKTKNSLNKNAEILIAEDSFTQAKKTKHLLEDNNCKEDTIDLK